ncbi:MAG: DUF4157 domain-containing protein [Massilia sp.]
MHASFQAKNAPDAGQSSKARTVAQKRVLADNLPAAVVQAKLAEMINSSPGVLQQMALSDAIHTSPLMVAQRQQVNALFGVSVQPRGDGAMPVATLPAQRKENNTGLPNQLKSGIESLSGMSMDHVRVHYHSAKPAQLKAHAYAQGSEIHVAPGQEKHVPHEAWHVVQQAQGRVKATTQCNGAPVNNDVALEQEADRMGARALSVDADATDAAACRPASESSLIQRKISYEGDEFTTITGPLETYLRQQNVTQAQGVLRWLASDNRSFQAKEIVEMLGSVGAAAAFANKHLAGKLNYKKLIKESDKKRQEKIFVQTPGQRGDMHDIAVAMHLDPRARVVVGINRLDYLGAAFEILDFYADFKDRVAVAPTADQARQSVLSHAEKGANKVTIATEMVEKGSRKDHAKTRALALGVMIGKPSKEAEDGYRDKLVKEGFKPGVPYMLVNYRTSGHPKAGRGVHPELDTGSEGFAQLIAIVRKNGFVPVPMGSPPAGAHVHPNLIDYFRWDCCQPRPDAGQNRRQAEYGLLHYLGQHYNVRAIAMRSGLTDVLAYVGIETISLDINSDLDGNAAHHRAGVGGISWTHAKTGWKRVAKRRQLLPDTLHLAFFKDLREDRTRHSPNRDQWDGMFTLGDTVQIGAAVNHYFGGWDRYTRGKVNAPPVGAPADIGTYEENAKSHAKKSQNHPWRKSVRDGLLERLLLQVTRLANMVSAEGNANASDDAAGLFLRARLELDEKIAGIEMHMRIRQQTPGVDASDGGATQELLALELQGYQQAKTQNDAEIARLKGESRMRLFAIKVKLEHLKLSGIHTREQRAQLLTLETQMAHVAQVHF